MACAWPLATARTVAHVAEVGARAHERSRRGREALRDAIAALLPPAALLVAAQDVRPTPARTLGTRLATVAVMDPERVAEAHLARRYLNEHFESCSGAHDARVLELLGRLDVTLASRSTDAIERAELSQEAARTLERALVKVHENLPIVRAILSGDLVTVSFPDVRKRVSIAVPKSADGDTFRADVRGMLERPLPRFGGVEAQADFYASVLRFQARIDAAPKEETDPIAESLEKAGLDSGLLACISIREEVVTHEGHHDPWMGPGP